MPKNFYNPAEDPKVINGLQEAEGFHRGDAIEFTNPNGVVFYPFHIIGFLQEDENTKVYLDFDCYWYAVPITSIRKVPVSNQYVLYREEGSADVVLQ